MEPLTILGGVAASVQFLEQGVKFSFACVEFYKRCQEAPEIAKQQQFNLQIVYKILAKIKNDKTLQTDDMYAPVQSCNEVLSRIEKRLKSALHGVDDSDVRKIRKRIIGASIHEKMKELFVQLDWAKSSLQLVIGLSHSDLLGELREDREHRRFLEACAAGKLTSPRLSREKPIALYEVPSQEARVFVGRENVLDNIERLLHSYKSEETVEAPCGMDESSRIVVLRALGGQGKTQVALRLCRRLRDKNLFAILWIDASSEDTVQADYCTYARLLQTEQETRDDARYNVAYLKRRLQQSSRGFLLIMDNYDDPTTFGNLQDYIPDNPKGRILVTSRHSDAGTLAAKPDEDMILPGLDLQHATDLLLQLSRIPRNDDSERHCSTIAGRLACHPLAITQASTFIRKQDISVSRFLDRYESMKAQVLQLVVKPSPYHRRLPDADEEVTLSVFATWELSFQQMMNAGNSRSIRDQGCHFLAICAFLGQGGICESLFSGYSTDRDENMVRHGYLDEALVTFKSAADKTWNHRAFGACISSLYDFALVESYHEVDDQYHLQLHPLVRDWLRLRHEKTRSRYSNSALLLVGNALSRSFRGQNHYMMSEAGHNAMMVHVRALDANASEDYIDNGNHSSLDRAMQQLHCQEGQSLLQPVQLLNLLEEEVPTSTQLSLPQHLCKAVPQSAQRALGWCDGIGQGSTDHAGDVVSGRHGLEQLVLRGASHQSSGAPDMDCCLELMQISCSAYSLARNEGALAARFASRTLVPSELHYTLEDLNDSRCSSNVDGLIFIAMALIEPNSPAAEAIMLAILAQYDRHEPDSEVDRAYAWFILGLAISTQDRHLEAIEHYRKAISQSTAARGPDYFMTIISKSYLAWSLVFLRRPEQADQILMEIVPLCRRIHGIHNVLTMQVEYVTTLHLLICGRINEGVRLQRTLLASMIDALGERYPATQSVMDDLQHVLALLGKEDEADELAARLRRLRSGHGYLPLQGTKGLDLHQQGVEV